jgi:hypothetical protein
MSTRPPLVDEAALGRIGPQLGHHGGQGLVYELLDHPDWLYKKYHAQTTVDVAALLELVTWPDRLVGRDRRIVDARTSWPRLLVQHATGHGVVIRRAPAQFTHVAGNKRTGTDLQFACLDNGKWGGAGPADPRTAICIVYRYAEVLDVFHRHDVVYGDMSYTNMLWSSATGWPGVFVIDCDATWLTTGRRALPAGQTWPWEDPWPDDGSALRARRTDLFKLGQLFLRAYYHWGTGKIGLTTTSLGMRPDPPVTGRIVQLLTGALQREQPGLQRPEAAEWLVPLRNLERQMRSRASG